MLEFRRNARLALEALRRGEQLLLTYRGRPVARLEPVRADATEVPEDDPLLHLDDFAVDGPGGPLPNGEIDRRDPNHTLTAWLVRRLIKEGARLVTTDYVLGESCTLVKARSGPDAALRLLELLDETVALDVEWIGPERWDRAKALFRKHRDQAFSFTDCTSFSVMRERRITEAITSDAHFRIAGFRPLPEQPRSP
jgi:predicted nucleic acid-binding protein